MANAPKPADPAKVRLGVELIAVLAIIAGVIVTAVAVGSLAGAAWGLLIVGVSALLSGLAVVGLIEAVK